MPKICCLHPDIHVLHRIQSILSAIEGTVFELFTETQNALAHAQHNPPDLVISELCLTEKDQGAFIHAIQALPQHTPVLLVGESGSVEQVLYGLQVGAAGFIHENKFNSELLEHTQRVLNAADKNKSQTRLLECMQTSCCTFVIDNDPSLLPTLLGRFQASVSMFGVCDESGRTRIGIALEEAMSNAMYHGNLEVSSSLREEGLDVYYAKAAERRNKAPYKQRKLHVTEKIDKDQAMFIIRDEGPGFDTSKLNDCEPDSLEAVSGRGLMLMQAFMDEVHFNECGNQVTLIKYKDRCKLSLAA